LNNFRQTQGRLNYYHTKLQPLYWIHLN